MTTATGVQTPGWPVEAIDVRQELVEDGLDLPELADTMEEADARATASTYLFALRSIKRNMDANDAEFGVLQDYNRTRHVDRQSVLVRQTEYLQGVLNGLFGFMQTGKKKSLNLIGGRVGMRAQQDELIVESPEAVIEHAEEYGIEALIRTKKSVDLKGLRKHMTEKDAGEIDPPGVKLEERPDVFFATPAD